MLGDGIDRIRRGRAGVVMVWQLWGWLEQRAAQVLEQPQTDGGHGVPAPAGRGPVEHRSHQGQAGVLAGQPADGLDSAAGLTEGPFDEVGVPDPGPVLAGETQVDGEGLAVGEPAAHRRGVGVRQRRANGSRRAWTWATASGPGWTPSGTSKTAQ